MTTKQTKSPFKAPSIELPLSGKYRLVKSLDQEMNQVTLDTGEISNIITDVGLEMLGTTAANSSENFRSSFLSRFYVGSGSSTPLPSDTQLNSLVATSPISSISAQTASYAAGYMELVVTAQYAQGAAAGNLSEIGIGPSSTNLFSRTRIVNTIGEPTTITILPNEFLTVFYTLRCAIPQSDVTYTVSADIDGVPTPITVTLRPGNANISGQQWGFRTTFEGNQNGIGAGAILPPDSGSPQQSLTLPTSSTRMPYVSNSHELRGEMFFDINAGSNTFTRAFYKFGPGAYQLGFSPGLFKDNTKTLRLNVGYSWSRG